MQNTCTHCNPSLSADEHCPRYGQRNINQLSERLSKLTPKHLQNIEKCVSLLEGLEKEGNA